MKRLIAFLFIAAAVSVGAVYSLTRASDTKRAFFYWKTVWKPSPVILEELLRQDVSRLYVRFFDVKWNLQTQIAEPEAMIRFEGPLPSKIEIVPVVYITNSVFVNAPYADAQRLAEKVWKLVEQIASTQNLRARELMIDCDWSETSRQSYFRFAQVLKEKARAQGMKLSATIRLHQVKYAKRTGVPPVDRGMLMFYNFARIEAQAPRSSIFNSEDARKYARFISGYSLPLDISLPLFSWGIHARGREVIGLLRETPLSELEASGRFEQVAPERFRTVDSFFFHGEYFRKDDFLILENTSPSLAKEAALLAAESMSRAHPYETVALFDLDEKHEAEYASKDYAQIFNRF